MKMTKKSNDIQKKIASIKNEIQNLQSNLADVENSLSREKQEINFDNAESLDEIKSLKNERDLILELIEEKQGTIQKLEDDLDIHIEIEDREKTIEQLIKFAKEAKHLEDDYHIKLEELDSILSEKIPEIIHIRSEWEKTAKAFMNLGDKKLGRGLRQGTHYTMVKSSKGDELTDKALLQELEQKGVNLKAVTSGRVLSTQHFTNVSNAKETEHLFFGENLFRMMRQSNIPELLSKND